MTDHIKHLCDAGAALCALGTFVELLPALAALLSVIWYLIRMYEWIVDRRKKKDAD